MLTGAGTITIFGTYFSLKSTRLFRTFSFSCGAMVFGSTINTRFGATRPDFKI